MYYVIVDNANHFSKYIFINIPLEGNTRLVLLDTY